MATHLPLNRDILKASDFELWRAVAQAAFDRRSSHGTGSLTDAQRCALAVWAASGMIHNRGFFDHSQEELAEWAAAYDALEITDAAEAIRAAARLMPGIDWGGDDPAENDLDAIEQRYYSANEETKSTIATFLREHPTDALAGLLG